MGDLAEAERQLQTCVELERENHMSARSRLALAECLLLTDHPDLAEIEQLARR